MSAAEEKIELNTDPRIKSFSWDELVRYNMAFLKGEKKSTFYHASSLLPDQVPEDLLNIHKLGIFTIGGQGNELNVSSNKESGYTIYQQRAYLEGLMPLALVEPFLKGARRDDSVVFELSYIKTKSQLYLSPELASEWNSNGSFVVTRGRSGPTKQAIKEAKWEDYTGSSEPMLMLYLIEDKGFDNWETWVDDGLCYFTIVEKNWNKTDISLPNRILNYYKEYRTNYKVEGGARRTRYTRRKH